MKLTFPLAACGLVALTTGGVLGVLGTRDALAADPPELPVFLDGDLAISFRDSVAPRRVDADTIRIRTSDGRQARGSTLLGRFAYDPDTQRRVVVRPEAVREYYQLVSGMSRVDAATKADRLLRRIERSGRTKKLDAIDRGLRPLLGVGYGAGTRLDDPAVTAFYPAPVPGTDELAAYRRLVAGDDALWRAHTEGDLDAFAELSADSDAERFFHPVEPSTGVPAAASVLRMREHRRVLIQRNRRTVLFLPEIPIRDDLSDAGLAPGETYELSVRRPLHGARRVLAALGEETRLAGGAALLVARDVEPLFAGPDERAGEGLAAARPRLVNVTPPGGETHIDVTTDWEDPDDQFRVPVGARSDFVIRLRFAHPLDPRTVNATRFRLYRTAVNPGTPEEVSVFEDVEVGLWLAQTRLGEVRVDVTPVHNLDPRSRYELRVVGTLRSLSGALLNEDIKATSFETL